MHGAAAAVLLLAVLHGVRGESAPADNTPEGGEAPQDSDPPSDPSPAGCPADHHVDLSGVCTACIPGYIRPPGDVPPEPTACVEAHWVQWSLRTPERTVAPSFLSAVQERVREEDPSSRHLVPTYYCTYPSQVDAELRQQQDLASDRSDPSTCKRYAADSDGEDFSAPRCEGGDCEYLLRGEAVTGSLPDFFTALQSVLGKEATARLAQPTLDDRLYTLTVKGGSCSTEDLPVYTPVGDLHVGRCLPMPEVPNQHYQILSCAGSALQYTAFCNSDCSDCGGRAAEHSLAQVPRATPGSCVSSGGSSVFFAGVCPQHSDFLGVTLLIDAERSVFLQAVASAIYAPVDAVTLVAKEEQELATRYWWKILATHALSSQMRLLSEAMADPASALNAALNTTGELLVTSNFNFSLPEPPSETSASKTVPTWTFIILAALGFCASVLGVGIAICARSDEVQESRHISSISKKKPFEYQVYEI